MRIRLYGAEIVDRDHLDILAPGFDDRAQHQAPDAAKTVNGDANGHVSFLFSQAHESGFRRGFGSNPERPIEFLIGRAGAEILDSDEGARFAYIVFPAEWRSRF